MLKGAIATTSWDDGAPADVRLAEVLARHGLGATFYVPRRNREGRSVMPDTDLRAIASRFEIGAHTLDHVYLDSVPPEEAAHQITAGKDELEQALGRPVTGFAYPGGRRSGRIGEQVRAAGFAYARTTGNFWSRSSPHAPFEIPTTIQIYPHTRHVRLRNFLRQGHFRARVRAFSASIGPGSQEKRLLRVIDACARENGYCHLWGHGWEIEEAGLWPLVERVLAHLARTFPRHAHVDNAAAVARLGAQWR